MQYLPIFVRTKDIRCVVIGGGTIAARKVETLARTHANITVVSPEICSAIETLCDEKRVIHKPKAYEPSDLQHANLIFAATDNGELNATVSQMAQTMNIPVNVVDAPSLCSFIMPSIVDRSPVVIAISTGGAAPVLARMLRARLETMIPASYGKLAELMKNARERVKKRFTDSSQRRRFWESVVSGPVAERMFEGKNQESLVALNKLIEDPDKIPQHGEVYLVGAGPGDPDLLTFRALRLMQQADFVVYDRLVAAELVALCRKDAERIYVGKKRDQHALAQSEINALLVDLATQGKRVLRLKGGDPFIFGRGGEEIETLAEQEIPFQIVPGITAASGCAAYAGIPLTHRDYAQQCLFVTGHMKDGVLDLPWQTLVQPNQTVAVYMGLQSLPEFTDNLISAGLSPQTPTAIIERGTTPDQRVLVSTVADLARASTEAEFISPSIVIVGEVVRLRERYRWFDLADTPPASIHPDKWAENST